MSKMARNDTEKVADIKDTKPRKTLSELQEERVACKKKALEKALLADKVRYKSTCDSKKFHDFLQHRLSLWETKKEDTFHAKTMYEKTRAILTDFEF